ncbi:uncharacterized protein LOC129748882 [Uranotaenia lowii]|uniref:uncharacterized protein LOC129748882 n=1 Tax=Uranotaenia lowii TaxID=190385 RepID=UPI002479AF1E|nr:uncharacterized protein LOC129748882 [Uranotaenia lowii]
MNLSKILQFLLAIKIEEVGNWTDLWRRFRFTFDTDSQFRLECIGVLLAFAFTVTIILWTIVSLSRRTPELEPRTALLLLEALEDNRKSLREVVHILKRPVPEPAIVPLAPEFAETEPSKPAAKGTEILMGPKLLKDSSRQPSRLRERTQTSLKLKATAKDSRQFLKDRTEQSKRPVVTK